MARRTHLGWLSLALVGLGGGVLGGACKYRVENADHCTNHEGDRYCAMRFPDQPLCSSGATAECSVSPPFGCVAADELLDGCHDPCGALSDDECTDTGSSSGSSSGSDTSASTSSDTGSSDTTMSPMPCLDPGDCLDLDAPYCADTLVCVPCDQAPLPAEADAACAALDPTRPVCNAGVCVSCSATDTALCDDQRFVCDEPTGDCLPCRQHEQCASGACELALGLCFPLDTVQHIDGDGPADYPSIGAALPAINGGELAVLVIHELDGGAAYQSGINIAGNRIIALIAAPGEQPVLQGTGGNPSLTITGAGTVIYLDGVDLMLASDVGLHVDASLVWVDRSRIVQNSGGGILAENGAQLTVRSAFVGQDTSSQVSISVDGSDMVILNSTVLGGFGMSTAALQCTGGSAVDIRNSVFATLSTNAELTCPGAAISYSVAEVNPGGEGSVALGPVDETIMADLFVDYTAGDFHLATGGAMTFADVAQWQTGDPITDIDGDPRPTVDLTPDFAGADIP